jgi:hypothetical protein
MAIESALIKPLVDAILGLAKVGGNAKLKRGAAKAVNEAIQELLRLEPDENAAEAKIAIAKAAGLISPEVLLADEMLKKVKDSKKKMPKKTPPKRATKRAKIAKKPNT